MRRKSLLRRSVWLLVSCSLLCATGTAQESFTPPTQATPDDIYHWLQSGDPRMVAWGAYFAGKSHDTAMVPYLQGLAAQWAPLPQGYNPDGSSLVRTGDEQARTREISAVLDALLQMHSSVEPEAIEKLMPDFSGQALTLFAYMPEPQRQALAIAIYSKRLPGAEYWAGGSAKGMNFHNILNEKAHPLAGFPDFLQQYQAGDLIYLAAAILAAEPPPGFAASLLKETNLQLEVVADGKDLGAVGIGGACGDSLWIASPKDWPPHWTYVVEESWPRAKQTPSCVVSPLPSKPAVEPNEVKVYPDGVEVIVPGTPALTTRRAQISSSCSAMEPFSSRERIELLSQMLGVTGHALGWGLREHENVSYTNDAAFQDQVQHAAAQREQAYRATAAALLAKGLISVQEADNSIPSLSVVVRDERQTKVTPLPVISVTYGKTVMLTSTAR